MLATVTINSQTIKPKPKIRVLDLQIDTKLRWSTHVQNIQVKIVNQSIALTKISTST